MPGSGARHCPSKRRWPASGCSLPITVEQYHRLIEQGTLPEDATVELLRGALVRKDRSVVGADRMGA